LRGKAIPEMTSTVLGRMLNPSHSLTHLLSQIAGSVMFCTPGSIILLINFFVFYDILLLLQ